MFPDLTAEQVLAATAARWDLDGPIPVPRPGWLACPVCRHRQVQARYWRFFERRGGTVGYRCDVSIKCCACAAVWDHGVALDADAYQRMTEGLPQPASPPGGRRRARPVNSRVTWREARALINDTERGS